jgi:general secretion pathway protein G
MVSAMKPIRLRRRAFTLIELLVVLAIVALLLTIGAPRYFRHLDLSREQVLRANLAVTRHVLDKYYEDNGLYPETLAALVDKGYLRAIPIDPLTGKRDTWVVVAPDDPAKGGVLDVHSGAPGAGLDGSAYAAW